MGSAPVGGGLALPFPPHRLRHSYILDGARLPSPLGERVDAWSRNNAPCGANPSSGGLSPATFSRKGRRGSPPIDAQLYEKSYDSDLCESRSL